MTGDDLSLASAGSIADAIKARKLSPVEVMDHFIKRIEERNPSLNAVVHLAPEEGRKAAKAAEQAVMMGKTLGPLHGVPVAIKDLFDFKPGWPATLGGIRALKDFRPNLTCPFAERIEQRGGAIIIGKTNSPVMGFRGITDNYLFGPTGNPFDTNKNPGGSSGGSAAAVADGLFPLAEGTDGRRLDPHPRLLVRRLWLQGRLRPLASVDEAQCLFVGYSLHLRGPAHPQCARCSFGAFSTGRL